ncbi:MAG: DUF302 domain-containing protein [Gemmatimonadota bacterium]|nr:DUF302 domain-containing protein [Gemmatimonadota bacterium]MDH4350974.1 DUF302 domain-containing protein [Gemmatimonadota bacterium]MDH5196961.1 DUF302 domain-containing protein [Gemmatimonadota bacterium]
MSDPIAFEVALAGDYDSALERVTAALKAEGFGILTRIDVHTTLKEKIDVEFRPYAILGACNPRLAHRALSHDAEVGLLLPCNVTVEVAPGGKGCIARIADPKMMMSAGRFGDDATLASVAQEARDRLARVAAALRGD